MIRSVFRVLEIFNFPAYVNCNAMVVLHNCAKIYVLDLQFTYDKKKESGTYTQEQLCVVSSTEV